MMLVFFLLKNVVIEFILVYRQRWRNRSNLNEKSNLLKLFSLYIKLSEENYYKRNWETILNGAKVFYENNREELQYKKEINLEEYLKKRGI